MNLEGRIDIRLQRRGDAPATVAIHSTRPQLAQRLMAGRTPEEAAHLAGLVFSLCGKAQRVAAEAACAAAAGRLPDAAGSREQDAAVLLELAQEHAWLKTYGRADLDPSLVPYNGRVKEYRVELSDDDSAWREVARGAFDASPDEKEVRFEKPASARYLRFVAVSAQQGEPNAALAEIRAIEAP